MMGYPLSHMLSAFKLICLAVAMGYLSDVDCFLAPGLSCEYVLVSFRYRLIIRCRALRKQSCRETSSIEILSPSKTVREPW
ncbi:hypothetical protein EV127DRAFT_59602 [Xylaria flabelliformis]|nr:hypothetical protein EV127DRAFT_59602 [Xylaria flabelliformis]